MDKLFEFKEDFEINALKNKVFQQQESDRELLRIIENRFNNTTHKIESYSKPAISISYLDETKVGHIELEKLKDTCKNQFFRKKQILFYEQEKGNFIYFIKKGKIKTTKNAEDGRELNVGIYSTEQYVGSAILFSIHGYNCNAIAIEDSIVCKIPIQDVERLVQLYSDLASKFITILANEISEKDELLLYIAYSSARKRIAHSLLLYSNNHCKNGENIKLSRNEIANLSATSPETISRILLDFENEGLISKNKTEIILLNMSKLSKLKN